MYNGCERKHLSSNDINYTVSETWTNWPIWWHYMVIHVPDDIIYPEHGFLYVSRGSNTDRYNHAALQSRLNAQSEVKMPDSLV